MVYRVTILHSDGRQESLTTDAPNYVSMERSLTDGHIKSFIVSIV